MAWRELELTVFPNGAVEYLKAEEGELVEEGGLEAFDAIRLCRLFAELGSRRRTR